MSIKIFVTYHKEAPVFRNNIFEPIQTGCDDASVDLNFLKDNTGDNISYKNKNYGELSAWYWVWKNYLPAHPELEYVGFCHYRRFLFFNEIQSGGPFRKVSTEEFTEKFSELYDEIKVEKFIKNYDILLPQRVSFISPNDYNMVSIYEQYSHIHPVKDLDCLMNIFSEKYPDDIKIMQDFFNNFSMYICMIFVMKRALFEDLCSWMFDLLGDLENRSDWSDYTDYVSIRTPAYLAERFFNIWLEKKLQICSVKKTDSVLLS